MFDTKESGAESGWPALPYGEEMLAEIGAQGLGAWRGGLGRKGWPADPAEPWFLPAAL